MAKETFFPRNNSCLHNIRRRCSQDSAENIQGNDSAGPRYESGRFDGTPIGFLTSAVSSLASLAGLSVGAENASAQSVAVLQSDFLTEKFIEQNQLLPLLVVQPKHAGGRNSHPAEQPHLWQADQYFKRHILNVATDERTGLVTVTVQWRHPDAAAQWANALVKMTNDYLRQKAIAETERDIAYLKDQAATTDVVGIKGAIYSLLQSQIGRAMLARGSDEYAFKVLDPAIAPAQPDSPQFMIWVLLGFFAGAILAFLCAFALVAWRKS